MRKKMGLVVAAAVFSLLLTGFPALAGGKGQGGKFINGQPSGWSRGAKKGWQKKGAVAPPGIQKKGRLPKGLQKKALQYPTYLIPI